MPCSFPCKVFVFVFGRIRDRGGAFPYGGGGTTHPRTRWAARMVGFETRDPPTHPSNCKGNKGQKERSLGGLQGHGTCMSCRYCRLHKGLDVTGRRQAPARQGANKLPINMYASCMHNCCLYVPHRRQRPPETEWLFQFCPTLLPPHHSTPPHTHPLPAHQYGASNYPPTHLPNFSTPHTLYGNALPQSRIFSFRRTLGVVQWERYCLLQKSGDTALVFVRDNCLSLHRQLCVLSQTTVCALTDNCLCSHRQLSLCRQTTVCLSRDNCLFSHRQLSLFSQTNVTDNG